jgi:hypothetical protein
LGAVAVFVGYTAVRVAYFNKIHEPLLLLGAALLAVGSGSQLAFSAVVKCAALNFPKIRGFATSVPMAAFGLSAFFISSIGKLVAKGDTDEFLSLLSFIPAALFICTVYFIRFRPPKYIAVNRGALEMRELGVRGHQESPYETYHVPDSRSSVGPDIYGAELLKTRLFWWNFLVVGILSGVSQMYIYSCGYCVRALVSDPDANASTVQSFQSTQVGVISIASFVGRLLSGTLSDFFHNKYQISRPMFLFVSAFLSLCAQILGLSVSTVGSLWIVSTTTGLAYGVCYGLYPTIVSEEFGLNHFSQNWGLLAMAPVPVSYTLNMMFGALYDMNSTIIDGHAVCTLGRACYSRPFMFTSIASAVCLFVLIPMLVFYRRN